MLFGFVVPSLGVSNTGDKVESKYMYYWDKNDVVNHSPAITFLKSLSNYWNFQWNQEFDAVTGASRRLGFRNVGQQGDHNLVLDGITGASKKEIRHSEQASLAYSHKGHNGSASFYFSDENDYTSYSPALGGSWDFNERNTTLGGGVNLFLDHLHPQGVFAGLGGDRKITSSTLSLTQILSPSTLVAITANSIHSSGVLGHPYNPVVLGQGGMLIENLPTSKTSLALTGQLIQGYHLVDRRSSLHLEARYYQDSWKLASQTAEIQVYQYLTENAFLRVRTRVYRQTHAALAKQQYQGNEVYRTADIRFFDFTLLSLGVKLASSFPDTWADIGLLPDRWDFSYDQGIRNTRGEGGSVGPYYHYQLFPRDEYYMQGTFMMGLGWDF